MGAVFDAFKFWVGMEAASIVIGIITLLCIVGFVVGLQRYNKSMAPGSRIAQKANRSAGITLMVITGIPLALVLFVEILPYVIFGAIFDSVFD